MALTKEALAEVLVHIPGTLRALSAENTALKEKLAQLEMDGAQSQLAEEVLDMMDEQDLGEDGLPRKQKVASLLASGKDLDVIKKALELRVPDMSFSKVASREDREGDDAFESFIVSGS